MNTPEYRKAYMASLKAQTAVNNMNLVANRGSPATQQYMQNTGHQILGAPAYNSPTNVQPKGTKFNGFK